MDNLTERLQFLELECARLRKNEALYRGLAENIADVYWVVSPDWRCVLYVSPAYEKIWGRSCASLYANGLSWLELVHPLDFASLHAAIEKKTSGDHADARFPEYRIVRPDGELRWISARAFPLSDSEGRIERVAGVAKDITTFKKVEHTLVRERDLAQLYLDTVDVILLVLDEKGCVRMINRKGAEILEVQRGDIIGKYWFETFIDADSQSSPRHVFDEFLLGDIDPFHRWENRIVTASGKKRLISWHNTHLVDEGGQVNGTLICGVDVTTERENEYQLQKSRYLLNEAQRMAQLGSWEWQAGDDLVLCSETMERIHGREPQAVARSLQSIEQQVHPADRAVIQRLVREAANGEHPLPTAHYRIVRPDGEVRYLLASAKTIRTAEEIGAPVLIGTVLDITELKRAELAQRESQSQRIEQETKHRDTLVREVHHRIKNNLQGILGLMRQELERHPALCNLLRRVIGQLQGIAIMHGLQGRQGRLFLCDMVQAIVQETGKLVDRPYILHVPKGQPFQVNENESLPVALILNELVVNAFKHSRENRPVQIDVVFEGGGAAVRMQSWNVQLPPLFDFTNGQTLGVGLQLVQSLLPKHGARLDMENTERGVLCFLLLSPPVIVVKKHATDGHG